MLEHFRNVTMHKIGGKAKAMVVTPSRLHAVRYMNEFKRQIKEKGFNDLEVLVAFSGEVVDEGVPYTEESINKNKNGETIIFNSRNEAAEYFKYTKSTIAYGKYYKKGNKKNWKFELMI